MRLFLDSSVLLAASGSNRGASHHLIISSEANRWTLVTSVYCATEVDLNVRQLGADAEKIWEKVIRPRCPAVQDCWALDRPLLNMKSKDRPVLITALAEKCDVLLTLDRADFSSFFDRGVYGMKVMTPGMFLRLENS